MPVFSDLPHSGDIRRVVVLGHSGFIGSHLERFFRNYSPEVEFVGRSFSPFDLTKEDDAASLTELFDLNTAVIMCSAIKKQLGDNLNVFSQNLEMAMNI